MGGQFSTEVETMRRMRPSLGGPLALVGSLVLHALLIAGFLSDLIDPLDTELPFRFEAPAEVEFGTVEGGGEPGPAQAPPPAPEPPKQAEKPKRARRKRPPKPKVVAASTDDGFGLPVDASVPDPEEDPKGQDSDNAVAGEARDGSEVLSDGVGMVQGAVGEGGFVGVGGHGLGGFSPPGAHIGLHVHVRRVARSSLILEVRSLMGIIPGWEGLLERSGLDPLRHLSHVFVASPNLRRERVVVAGRMPRNELMQKAVARLAKKQGAQARWGSRGGARVAPWFSADGVKRVVALDGSERFIITREDDLNRVVSVVRALASEGEQADRGHSSSLPSAVAARLRGEAVALTIDDTATFVVGDRTYVPKKVRLSVRSLDEYHALLTLIGEYGNASQASAAFKRGEGLRVELLDHEQVKYLGLVSAVETGELAQEGRFVIAALKLTMHQTRFVLDMVREAMSPGK